MILTLAELRAAVRERVRDDIEPYFFADETLNGHINEAEEEACLRAKLLYDSSATMALVAGRSVYRLREIAACARFFLIDRFAMAAPYPRVLRLEVLADMDRKHPGWEDASAGIPEVALMDQAPCKITIWPTPSIDVDGVVVRLRGFRYPAWIMEGDEDTPEIDAAHHLRMLDWAISRCYSTHDFDAYNPELSRQHEAAFVLSFGPRPDAALQALMARRETMRRIPRMHFCGGM